MDIKQRMKNPFFWIGLIGIVLTAIGADPATFTSWGSVLNACKMIVTNPYMLLTVIGAVLGVFVDPTTRGLNDNVKRG